jgi:iron/zinc/copper transport system ATP-binding protein
MLRVESLRVGYEFGPVLQNFSVAFPPGQIIGIIGPNGAGKSTLIKAIVGINKPTTGRITFDDEPVNRRTLRQTFSYVPQRSDLDLTFPINVTDLVLMGLMPQMSRWHSITKTDEQRVATALAKLEIDHLADRSLNELSGGQRQRALMARALVQDAEVYLLDEPFVGIDAASENTIMAVLHQLRDAGKTIIIVHHDLGKVERYFDQVLLMNHELLGYGAPRQVLSSTALYHAYGDALVYLPAEKDGGVHDVK